MTSPQPTRQYRFGVFEADRSTGELRKNGLRIKLNAQPFQVLLLLLARPGELLTREEISGELWPDGTFVDYEHGVNSAVNRIREALGDTASNPRFVQTLARRGYRFVAPVERVALAEPATPLASPVPSPVTSQVWPMQPAMSSRKQILASAQDLPKARYSVVQTLFLLLQLMYLAFYVGALANLGEIGDLFLALPLATQALLVTGISAALLIPVRAFLICAALFHAPRFQRTFRRLWPFLLLVDELWALSPFLLLHHINYGVALSCTALLVYLPFVQRSLVLMGAGAEPPELSGGVRTQDP